MFRRLSLSALLLVGSVQVALAQPLDKDQTKGRDLATSAFDLYQKEKFAEALVKFQEAEKLYPTAQVLRMEGYTLMALKRYVEAIDLLERAIETKFKPLLPVDTEDTEDQLKEARSKVARLALRSSVPGATVRIDGGDPRPLPQKLYLAPGKHRFTVEADAHEPVEEERTLEAGEVTLSLAPKAKRPESKEPPPPPPPPKAEEKKPGTPWFSHQREVGFAAAGLGVALAGTAIGLGAYGLSLEGAVQSNIDEHQKNYDPSCARNTAYCLADIELVNEAGARAARYRDAALATGLAGVGLAAIGGLFIGFGWGNASAAKDEAKPKSGAVDVGCGLTGVGAACRGTF